MLIEHDIMIKLSNSIKIKISQSVGNGSTSFIGWYTGGGYIEFVFNI